MSSFYTAKLSANQLERIKELKGIVFSVRGSCLFLVQLPKICSKNKKCNLTLIKEVKNG